VTDLPVNGPELLKSAPWWRSGKLVVLGILAGLIVGGYFYRETVPPGWLRAFGAEIALRAAADPNPPLPEDAREASPRNLADNPYICLARIVTQPWDRVVFVTHAQGKTLAEHETLGRAAWAGREPAQKQLSADDRYQLVVLLNGEAVVDSQLFFTFWADLAGVADPKGFARDTAIFTAESRAGQYVLAPASTVTPDNCPK